MERLPDIHEFIPEVELHLTRVGVSGVKKVIKVNVPNFGAITWIPTIDAYIDLPANKKGVHMSRSNEAITHIIEESIEKPAQRLETLCARIAKQLLEKHDYATRSEVKMDCDYGVYRQTPVSKKRTLEMCKVIARAVAHRRNGEMKIRKMIGAEVTGITTCPCAQEVMKQFSKKRLKNKAHDLGLTIDQIEKIINLIPTPTHTQRNTGLIMIEIPEEYDVNAEDLIKIIEESMSATTFEVLKRIDEAELIKRAHLSPMFTEDCVRNMLKKIIAKFSYLPDNVVIIVRNISEESVHKHNAIAERITTLGKLRKEIGS